MRGFIKKVEIVQKIQEAVQLFFLWIFCYTDPRYGEGIYFTGSVQSAMELWRDMENEEYLYFVEAQVLTGKSTPGKPEFIVPPAVGDDPAILYDSLSGGSDIAVIFSGRQALPTYIIICKKMGYWTVFPLFTHWGDTKSTKAWGK